MNIIKNFKTNKLAEIMQQKETRYAHAVRKGEDFVQVHQECLCRDFLGDVVVANKLNQGYQIYGMNYDPNRDEKIDLSKSGLLVYFPSNDDVKNFIKNFNCLTQLENDYGIKESKYEEVANNVFFVEGNGWWLEETYRFSFYTFVLRCLAYDVGSVSTAEELFKQLAELHHATNEKKYIVTHGKLFYQFVKTLPTLKKYGVVSFRTGKQYNLDEEIYTLHDYSGFFNYLRQMQNGDLA